MVAGAGVGIARVDHLLRFVVVQDTWSLKVRGDKTAFNLSAISRVQAARQKHERSCPLGLTQVSVQGDAAFGVVHRGQQLADPLRSLSLVEPSSVSTLSQDVHTVGPGGGQKIKGQSDSLKGLFSAC